MQNPWGLLPPFLEINAKFIKDISFENPQPFRHKIRPDAPPITTVNIELSASGRVQNTFEVVLKIRVHVQAAAPEKATSSAADVPAEKRETIYLVEVEYAGIFTIFHVPAEYTNLFLFVEASRILFPFARAVHHRSPDPGKWDDALVFRSR